MINADRDKKFMQQALKLAKRGIGLVEPNPAVGCVIVKDGRIIGIGWHKKFGEPHAEINAIDDCKSRGYSPANAVMYITLEPCCHFGKTPPCTQAVIAAQPAKVVIATLDPSEHTSGKGVQQLRDAGIDVQTGLCRKQARLLNAAFFKFVKTSRPWVILKWAQSIDGKLARQNESAEKWISNEKSRRDTHKLRRTVQGILVGINTVLTDDPLLTPRPSRGKKPLRIVADSNLRIPSDCKLMKTAAANPVLIVTTGKAIDENPTKAEKLKAGRAELLSVPAVDNRCSLNVLLDGLGKRKIIRLLVEGGPKILAAFLKERLADEVCIYIAPGLLGSTGKAGINESMANLADCIDLKHINIKQFDGDVRLNGLLKIPDWL